MFLATDGAKLFRADSDGNVYSSATLSAGIQSLTVLPAGISLPGASEGDIIACATTATNSRYQIYKLNNPFGAATLTPIGSLNHGIGSLVFAEGQMWGVEDSQAPITIFRFDPLTGNSVQSYSTGVNVAGCGGLAYSSTDSLFYFTDSTNNRLYRWTPSGGSSVVGSTSPGFSNNGIEFYGGSLYAALRQDSSSSTMKIGLLNHTTGAFTSQATVTGVTGAGTGFLAVPEPVSTAALAMGLAGVVLRRRKSSIQNSLTG
ncbi:MAG: PEP-CTERM sorting domain-containing protein [Armatimonadetes bacterium]|nr:PEP-CTERM sorting domain-containing protein [Armatimonadota bacterium]